MLSGECAMYPVDTPAAWKLRVFSIVGQGGGKLASLPRRSLKQSS